MDVIIHRVNTLEALQGIPERYGVELDVRSSDGQLILQHDPHQSGVLFEEYLDSYRHGLMVINIKEAGLEEQALSMARDAGVDDCFLLDVEFPYLYRAAQHGERSVAVRYSEVESLDTVRYFSGRVDWVWLDCFTRLPIDEHTSAELADFKICMVCPERWGRPEDILVYRRQLLDAGVEVNAVMTARNCAESWEASLQ